MENTKLIEILVKENDHLEITNQEAKSILENIKHNVSFKDEQDLEKFVKDDLCIFRDKEYAFNWFYDSEDTERVSTDLLDYDITANHINKNFKDILLEGNENYLEIQDGLYLTWWR